MSQRRHCAARAVFLAVAAAVIFGAGACSNGDDSPTIDDIDPNFGANDSSVVVALGDSITFGIFDTGVESCDESSRGSIGYPARLQSLVGKTVVNAGACGEDSYGGADRVESVLEEYRPGVLLIDYSPNDLFNGTDALIRNLRLMITAARNNNTVPVLGTLVPATGDHEGWESFIEAANEKIRALAEEQGIECADHFKAFVNDPGYIKNPYALLSEDGLHPNAAGYALMAKTWRWPLLRVY